MHLIPSFVRSARPVQFNSQVISKAVYHRRMRELDLEFVSGAQYQYGCVEPRTYREFLKAPSTGRYFVANIRGHHPFRRLEN